MVSVEASARLVWFFFNWPMLEVNITVVDYLTVLLSCDSFALIQKPCYGWFHLLTIKQWPLKWYSIIFRKALFKYKSKVNKYMQLYKKLFHYNHNLPSMHFWIGEVSQCFISVQPLHETLFLVTYHNGIKNGIISIAQWKPRSYFITASNVFNMALICQTFWFFHFGRNVNCWMVNI